MKATTNWPESVPLFERLPDLYTTTLETFGHGNFAEAWEVVCRVSHNRLWDDRAHLRCRAQTWNAAMAELGYTEAYEVIE